MSSHNEQVQPTPFDVAQPTPPTTQEEVRVARGTAPWVIPALGGLVLLAILVVFWLPERVNTPGEQQESAQDASSAEGGDTVQGTGTAAASKQTAEVQPDASPWSEAQAAKLRKEAQDVLAELLDIQTVLEERSVADWAPEEFAAATAFAAAGDELYRARQYEQAKASYEQGLAAMRSLQEAIPQEVARQLKAASEAIEEGDAVAATSALDMAALIEPENAALPPLRQRLEALPQLLELLEKAVVAERSADLANAERLLKEAVAVDSQHMRARDELQRVSAAYLEQRFNDAMSEGYTALDEGRFEAARKAFRAAGGFQSGSTEAASALQEVKAAETAYRLSTLKNRGSSLEKQENWQAAVDAYESAQKIDRNVLFASEGLQRSRGRARLDKQFRTALKEPQRLSDKAVAEAMAQLLGQAQQITPRGPVLEQQLSRLDKLLRQANTPVAVTLRSDRETEVIVQKIARLGRFEQHQLSLRPGTYTAVGTRNGYRDVRVSFTINHDSAPAPVSIACTEQI